MKSMYNQTACIHPIDDSRTIRFIANVNRIKGPSGLDFFYDVDVLGNAKFQKYLR